MLMLLQCCLDRREQRRPTHDLFLISTAGDATGDDARESPHVNVQKLRNARDTFSVFSEENESRSERTRVMCYRSGEGFPSFILETRVDIHRQTPRYPSAATFPISAARLIKAGALLEREKERERNVKTPSTNIVGVQ